MKEYLPIIKARSGLFSGIEEKELEKLFGCLEARKQTYFLHPAPTNMTAAFPL